ncbi:MAG TPA: SRPBCC family protein [Nevskiaceae bacterium]
MSDIEVPPAKFRHDGKVWEGQLTRVYDHGVAEVWPMLTQADKLAQWVAPGKLDLREGGHVHLDFEDSGIVIDSRITAFKPQKLIQYSWSSGAEPERPLRWELTPADDGTRLTLTVRVPESEDIVKAVAGFVGHLEMLAAALEGVPIKFPLDHYLEARKVYTDLKKKAG